MPRWTVDEEDWDEDEEGWDEDEDGEEDEAPEEDEEPTVPCPYCKRLIHEDSPRCPYCATYVSQEDAPPSRKPWWIIIGALLCLYAIYHWVIPAGFHW
jgi:hypothetical protein